MSLGPFTWGDGARIVQAMKSWLKGFRFLQATGYLIARSDQENGWKMIKQGALFSSSALAEGSVWWSKVGQSSLVQ
jgi:hypothetical protein